MTYEFKKILHFHLVAKTKGLKTVLATVVALEGSSYRRPGVRMLIREDGTIMGAVSGGCVEKEVCRQAESVFKTGEAKIMTYDGRYRLGCEGVLYLLLEPFVPTKGFLSDFESCLQSRNNFHIECHYTKTAGNAKGIGTIITFNKGSQHPLYQKFNIDANHQKKELLEFRQTMKPCFKLLIIGAEHDAVQLCSYASMTGWEVTVIAPPSEGKTITDFPGLQSFLHGLPETLDTSLIDSQTAVMVMNHNYAKDLKYLMALKECSPLYLGLLGPAKRREKLLNALMEQGSEISETYFDSIHGPAGLNIGAETPQEIAIAIVAEILSVVREQNPMMLKNKKGAIHN